MERDPLEPPPSRRARTVLLTLLMAALTATATPAAGTSLDSYRRARAAVERARQALGGAAAEAAVRRGLELRGEGLWDPAAELQGRRRDGGDPVYWRELLVLDGAADRLGWETDQTRHDGTREHLRFVYGRTPEGDGLLRFVHLVDRFAVADRGPALADDRRRLERTIPHLLLADVAAAGASLRHAGRGVVAGRPVERVTATLASGETLTLHLDADGLLRGFEQLVDMPLLGDTLVRWSFGGYRPVPGLGPYPVGYRIEVDGRRLKEVRYTRVLPLKSGSGTAGAGDREVFTIPRGIEPPAPPPDLSAQNAEPPPPAPRVTRVADGVWFAGNVRAGMHAMFVELDDGVAVLEAPSGYLELGMVPVKNFAAGESTSSVAERLLRAVEATLPGKPVRHLVLSHVHADHAGGLRPFVARGATIWAPPGSRDVLERAVRRPHTLPPDRLERQPAQPRIEIVRDRRVLGSGERQIHLLEVGPNPHADGMLVSWLPGERFLFVADLFPPWGRDGVPSPSHLPVMHWFVEWLDATGLEVERLFATHGAGAAGPEKLERIRAGAED